MNEIRPIDANALFERIGQIKPKNKQQYEDIGLFMNMITNAPTVELQMGRMINGVIIPIERPQGKWINANGEYMCTNCKSHSESIRPFCWCCGADMRGNKE